MVKKRFIVTGSSGAIGNLLVNELSESNKVDAIYSTNAPSAMISDDIRIIKIDLTDHKSISEYVALLKGSDEEIVFIHAAALSLDKLIIDVNHEDLINTFSVNLFSAFAFVKHLIPIMLAKGEGSFIFLSSVAPDLQIPGTSVYSASKVALEQLSNQIVSEYSQFNIRSNVLKLGYFNSGMIKKLSPKVFTSIIERIPSKNLGEISDIPKIIKLIVESSYINGSVISIDGGIN